MMIDRETQSLVEQLREAILRENARPAADQFRAMVEHGSINEKGEVLLKSPWTEAEEEDPEPKPKPKPKRVRKKAKRSKSG